MSLKQSVFDDFVNTRTQAEVENEIKKFMLTWKQQRKKKEILAQ